MKNQSAFPHQYTKIEKSGGFDVHMGTVRHLGLTKREYFAGLAMQALIPTYVEKVQELTNVAEASTDFADALLAELNKKEENK